MSLSAYRIPPFWCSKMHFFGDLEHVEFILTSHDVQNASFAYRTSKIHFWKICTQWSLVTLTWFWLLMMSKTLFQCIGTKKCTFFKFALDDTLIPSQFKRHHWTVRKISEILRYHEFKAIYGFYCLQLQLHLQVPRNRWTWSTCSYNDNH